MKRRYVALGTGLLAASALLPVEAQAAIKGIPADDLPSSFLCHGSLRSLEVRVEATLETDGQGYSVILNGSGTDGSTVGLQRVTEAGARGFVIESAEANNLVLRNLHGRRTTVLEVDLSPGHASFIDDGTIFFAFELACATALDRK